MASIQFIKEEIILWLNNNYRYTRDTDEVKWIYKNPKKIVFSVINLNNQKLKELDKLVKDKKLVCRHRKNGWYTILIKYL